MVNVLVLCRRKRNAREKLAEISDWARPEWSEIARKLKENPRMGVGHEMFD